MKKRKKRAKKGEPQTITKAVTRIRLEATNAVKLTALDALVSAYLELTQQYVTLFCTNEVPNGFRAPCFLTPLSERWHRNAVQQAAGIAKSWRSNRANAYQGYLDQLTDYQEQKADGTLEDRAKEPVWREWNVPTLREACLQATATWSSWKRPSIPPLTTGSR